MAFSTLRSTSQIPEIEKDEEDEEFDLLKLSKIKEGRKVEDVHTGFIFVPTNQEIVVFYLFNKILDRVLSVTDVIKEIDDLYEREPNQLPICDFRYGNKRNEAFYFTYIQQIYTSKGKVTKRTTAGGYWKVNGKEEDVTYRNVTVGFKNPFVFHRGQAPKGSRTPFVMHEYRLNPLVVPVNVLNDTIRTKIERYVVWRIINREAAK